MFEVMLMLMGSEMALKAIEMENNDGPVCLILHLSIVPSFHLTYHIISITHDDDDDDGIDTTTIAINSVTSSSAAAVAAAAAAAAANR